MEVKLIVCKLFTVYESASRLLILDLKRDHRWGKKLAASPLLEMFALDTMLAGGCGVFMAWPVVAALALRTSLDSLAACPCFFSLCSGSLVYIGRRDEEDALRRWIIGHGLDLFFS
jgi:hypothetical protein